MFPSWQLKRPRKVHDLEHSQHALLPHNPVPAPYFGLQAEMVPFTSAPREHASYQLARESCTRPLSRTSSELEPPIGSAPRTNSKNHQRSSCPTSTSDKKLMGSQGKESLFVSSAGTRKNQSSTTPELPPKNCSTRKQDDRALLEISGHSSRQKASKPSFPGGTEVADQMLRGGRKRKRTKNTVEPLPHDATTSDNLAFNDDPSCLQQGNNAMTCMMSENGLQNNWRKGPVVIDKSFGGCAKVPSPGAGNACERSKFDSLLSFEKLIKGDCLKLLNLDNDADEEKYRKAMETPLSPDVPIVLPTITKRHKSSDLVDGNNDGYDRNCPASMSDGNLQEVQNLSQNCRFQSSTSSRTEHGGSVMEFAKGKSTAAVNVSYNTKSVDVSATASLRCLSHGNEASNAVVSLAVESENTIEPQLSGNANAILHLCKEVPQICTASSDPELQNNVGLSKAETAQPINLTSDGVNGHCHRPGNYNLDFVGVTSLKRSSVINILHYWEALISESSKLPQDVFVDGSLLERVSAEPLLLPEYVLLALSLLFFLFILAVTSSSITTTSIHVTNINTYIFLCRERVPLIFSLLLWDARKLTSDPIVDQYIALSAFMTGMMKISLSVFQFFHCFLFPLPCKQITGFATFMIMCCMRTLCKHLV